MDEMFIYVPAKVPEGKYCCLWTWTKGYWAVTEGTQCRYHEIDGGHSTCNLALESTDPRDLDEADKGIPKGEVCRFLGGGIRPLYM